MKIALAAAKILQRLLSGEKQNGTAAKQAVISQLIEEGMIQKTRVGKNRYSVQIINNQLFEKYLLNQYGIKDLNNYILELENNATTKADLVNVSSSSKLKKVRSFQGFLVNSFEPIQARLNNQTIAIHPLEGSFTFIYDYENFKIDEFITVIGIENSENFRRIQQQSYLFKGLKVLFIARYPQTQHKDVIKWLQKIPNQYLHFGDFDFEGINIYMNEYKKHLANRASFFIPDNLESILKEKGNRDLYNKQLSHQPKIEIIEELGLKNLIQLLHQNKCCLEQEAFITIDN